MKLIGPKELRQIEPYCKVHTFMSLLLLLFIFLKGVMAIHSPYTGIVDYVKVAESYAEEIKERKGVIKTGYEVES